MGGLLGILIALWLVGYKLVEFGDKTGHKMAEKFFEERKAQWVNDVIDEEMEEDLKCFIRDPKNHDQVWREVREAYEQMPMHRSRRTWKNEEEALTIMMARRGKLPFRHSRHYENLAELPWREKEFHYLKSYWDEDVEFWEYIEDELLGHGVENAKLFFVGSPNSIGSNVRCLLSRLDKTKYIPGWLTWISLVRYRDDGKSIYSS